MPRTAEDAALPKVRVGGKDFAVGTVTIHQLFSAKNLMVSIITGARIRQAQRSAAATETAMHASQAAHDDIRAQVAEKLGIAIEDIGEAEFLNGLATYMQRQILIAQGALGDTGDAAGVLIDMLGALSEDQIIAFAVILLDRSTSTRITHEFIEQHFNLEWFTEALGYLLQHNHIPTLIKNLQRLASLYRIQTETLAEPLTNSPSTSD